MERPISEITGSMRYINERLHHLRYNYLNTDDDRYLIDASNFLRLFYCDKGRNGVSVLKQLQNRLNFTFYVYHEPGLDEYFSESGDQEILKYIKEGMVFGMFSSNLDWFNRGSSFVPLLSAIEKEVLYISQISYSPKKIIEVVSEKMGGAHLDPHTNKDEDALKSTWVSFGDKNQTVHYIQVIILNTILVIEHIDALLKGRTISKFVVPNNQEHFPT